MSDKESAVDEVAQSDDYPPEEQGARRAELLAGIKAALEQVERGETYTIDEVRGMMKEWMHQ